MNMRGTTGALLISVFSGSHAAAQSLFLKAEPVRVDAEGVPEAPRPLQGVSLMYVEEPKARKFQTHDIITIIVNETSVQSSSQTVDTKKNYTLNDQLTQFPSLPALLQFQLANGIGTPVNVDVESHNKFKGEGTYDRADRFTAKISATIIDVKPNGVLVLEAKKTRSADEESQTMVLSGTCRQEDVTNANTVLSSQLADLTLVQKNEGQIKDTATKGFIPRILEAIFNF